ncbi:MAG: RIP metalloprotease RseP [Methylophilaceae bacterium]
MLTLIAFLVTIGILVTVHEYGHYQVAKWCGVRILKFSIGFGKPLWSKTFGKDNTEFIIASIPLGGYVKFLDEREFVEVDNVTQASYSEADLQRAFNRQPVLKRMAVVLAGPFANLLLAILLYWAILMTGVLGIKPILGKVLENSPAAVAGFKENEVIQKINGNQVDTWQEASFAFLNASLKNTNATVNVLDNNGKTKLHKLNLAAINLDNPDQDALAVLGFAFIQPDIKAQIGGLNSDGPAAKAGLKVNDLILKANQQTIKHWQDFTSVIKESASKKVELLVQRNGEELTIIILPEAKIVEGKTIGMIGVAALDSRVSMINYSPLRAFVKATATTWDTSIVSLKLMEKLVTGQLSLKNMSGSLTIANAAGESADRGLKQFIGFLAFISISIGVMNLLPIPVLDGGHFMYYVVELLTRKPVPDSALMIGQKIGFFMLGLLMIIAFYNDINRLIIRLVT